MYSASLHPFILRHKSLELLLSINFGFKWDATRTMPYAESPKLSEKKLEETNTMPHAESRKLSGKKLEETNTVAQKWKTKVEDLLRVITAAGCSVTYGRYDEAILPGLSLEDGVSLKRAGPIPLLLQHRDGVAIIRAYEHYATCKGLSRLTCAKTEHGG